MLHYYTFNSTYNLYKLMNRMQKQTKWVLFFFGRRGILMTIYIFVYTYKNDKL